MPHSFRELVLSHNRGTLTDDGYLAQLRVWMTTPKHDHIALNAFQYDHDAFAWNLSEIMKSPDWVPLTDDQASRFFDMAQYCIDNDILTAKAQLPESVDIFPGAIQSLACLAAQNGHADFLKFCLDNGADFDTFLDHAALLGLINLSMLDLLTDMDWRSVRSSSEELQTLANSCVDKPVDVQAAIYAKGARCSIVNFSAQILNGETNDKIKVMLHEGRAKDSLKDSHALQFAARVGNLAVVDMLLDAGADIDEVPQRGDSRDPGPFTALCEAIREQHVDVVRLLLQRGARTDVGSLAFNAKTPMEYAEEIGNTEIVQLISRAVDKST